MALKPCKECKQEVSTGAKECPHCGAKHPTMNMGKGCLWIIIASFAISGLIMAFDDSEPTQKPAAIAAPEEPAKALEPAAVASTDTTPLSETERDQLIVDMTNFYLENIALLFSRHDAYKDRDRSVFINWRNNEWYPSFEAKQQALENTLKEHGIGVIDKHFTTLRAALGNLSIVSLNFMYSIRDKKPEALKKAQRQINSDLKSIQALLKEQNLESRITTPDYFL